MQSKYFLDSAVDICSMVDDQLRDRGFSVTGEARTNLLSNLVIELQSFMGSPVNRHTKILVITTVANRVDYFIICGLAEPIQHTEVFLG